MSECVYCRQGSITMGVDGPVCPDCLEEGYGLAARNAALRTPVKVMSIGEMAEDRIEELEAKLEKLERWQAAAFIAHGNLDLDIEANPEALAELSSVSCANLKG